MASAGESPTTAIRLGSYEVVHRFARGGMAELFLARSIGPEGFQKLVVLKKILPTFAANPKFVRLFLDEAKLAAGLDHPNIAHVYDLGNLDGNYFFTMEYVHGEDVRSILNRSLRTRQPLPIEHVTHVARCVANALHYAHDRRGPDGELLHIVHRDVSPANVIVSYEGTVKLLDFGVAKAASSTTKTRTGTLKGKVAYMSPEQAKGASVDRRSDVFSTGIVLWEMVTSRRLFKRDNDLATIQMIINEPPPAPSSLRPDAPPELDRIILRALAVDPDARYQTAQELQADLDEFAREGKLNQSSIALGAHMAKLFAPEIEQWKRAEAKGLGLAEHIVALAAEPRPAEATPQAFGDSANEDDVESIVDEPDPDFEIEADAEQTERGEVPHGPSPLVTSEAGPSVASRAPLVEARPAKEPSGWMSEPSIVLDDSVIKDEAPATAQMPVAVPFGMPELDPEATELVRDVARIPVTPIVAPMAYPQYVAPQPPAPRRIGVWIGIGAASVAIAIGFLVLNRTDAPRPNAAASDLPAAPEPVTAPTQVDLDVAPAPVAVPTAPVEPVAVPPAPIARPVAPVATSPAPVAKPAPAARPVPVEPPHEVAKPTRRPPRKGTTAKPKPKPKPATATKPTKPTKPAFDPNAALPPM